MTYTLKNFPSHDLAKEKRDQCPICIKQKEWLEGLKKELREKESTLFQQTKGYGWADAHRDNALWKLIEGILGK